MGYRRLLSVFVALMCCGIAVAQSTGTYSTYSRFGFGLAGDEVTGFNRGMGGVGIALHSSNRLNSLNPASYATIDSLSFLFDVGASFSFGQHTQGKGKVYTRGASFEYVVAGFRLRKGLGISFGFMPYSSIKYDFNHVSPVGRDNASASEIESMQNFTGDGGTNRAYIGVGWQPFRKLHNPMRLLSVGANVSLMWGTFNHDMLQSFWVSGSEVSSYSALLQSQEGDVLTYKIDLGLQLPIVLNGNNLLRTGITVGLGHGTGTEATLERSTSAGDTTRVTAKDVFDIPYTFGGGLAWEYKGMVSVAADYRFEKWADCHIPVVYTGNNGELCYSSEKGYYKNRHRINFGAELFPAAINRGHNASYLQRCRYRIGAFYSTPYMNVRYANTERMQNGPTEYGLTAGVGLPITNRINNRSTVNVAFQWLRRQPSSESLVTENYFMIHVGVSFGERWFMKYKIE